MTDKKVNEDLCKERSGNIDVKVDKLSENITHMMTNCLPTITRQLDTLEANHNHTTSCLDEIKTLITPKETNGTKIDKDTVKLAFKVMGILAIIICILLGGVDTGKELITGLFIGG